jgi:hypothetical protein
MVSNSKVSGDANFILLSLKKFSTFKFLDDTFGDLSLCFIMEGADLVFLSGTF